MPANKLLIFTENGLYCPKADVYLDPWKPVSKAIITHGHSDHARKGHEFYLCTLETLPVLKYRLGNEIRVTGLSYGEELTVNGVRISLHPAGHIIGSAQIRVEYRGDVWVFSGDYKTENDGISGEFEPIRCRVFITESTFALPVYRWRNQGSVFEEINGWWMQNAEEGVTSILTGYALGKAQRLLSGIDRTLGPVYCHGAIYQTNQLFPDSGIPITPYLVPGSSKDLYERAMVLAPPAAINSGWLRNFRKVSIATASGWMKLRGMRRRRGVDRGFVLSDHADWQGLNDAVKATGAEQVFLTHGYQQVFAKWLTENGLDARVVQTEFVEDIDDESVE